MAESEWDSEDGIIEAIREARALGYVPFVLVLPISPELLTDPSAASVVAQVAADDAARSVREWQAEGRAN